jgi:DNA-binding transcriptional MerR regulator
VKPHVLRYWEQEFTQLRPVKRKGNRRYYQHHEVLMIRRIRELLYEQGFTISGARNRLQEQSGRVAAAHDADPSAPAAATADVAQLESVPAAGVQTAAAVATLDAQQARWLAAELQAIRSLLSLT